MSAVISTSTKKAYGVLRVCRVWGVNRAGVYRHLDAGTASRPPPRRRGPDGAMPDAQMVETIKQVIQDSPFHGEGYRKVHARLQYKGIGISKPRVLRLMRENALRAKPCRGPILRPALS